MTAYHWYVCNIKILMVQTSLISLEEKQSFTLSLLRCQLIQILQFDKAPSDHTELLNTEHCRIFYLLLEIINLCPTTSVGK